MVWGPCGDPAAHLEVNVDVVSEDVHAEELATADLAGVLLISVGQQMLVHVAAAGEHLNTHTHLYTCMYTQTHTRTDTHTRTNILDRAFV